MAKGRANFSDTMSGLDDMPISGKGIHGVCIIYVHMMVTISSNISNFKLSR